MKSTFARISWVLTGLMVAGLVLPLAARDPGSPLTFSVRLEGSYDDNRDGVESDKESNFDTRLQPRAAFAYDVGQTAAGIYYMPSMLLRSNARDDQNDSEVYHELGVSLRHELAPAVLFKFSNLFSLTDDPQVSEAGVAVRANATHTRNVLNLGLDVGVDPVTELAIGGRGEIKRYQKSVWRNYDEDMLGASLALRREMGMQMRGMISTRYNKSEYGGANDRGAEYIFGGVGLERIFNPNLSADFNVGWNTANYNDVSGSKGLPAGDARVIVSPSPDTALTLAVKYQLTDSDWLAFSTQERTSFSAALDHRLTPQLSSGVTVMYANGEYKSRTALVENVAGGSDDMTAVRANAVFNATPNIDLEVGYQFENWDSDIRDSFTRNQVMLAVRARM